MEIREVYVTADMSGTGIEIRATADPSSALEMRLPRGVGLSEALTLRIESWQRWFNEVVYLLGLGNHYAALGDSFDEVGMELAKCVATELGTGYRVLYGPQGGWCRYIGRGQSLQVPSKVT
jgi:hypothetical protein